jgi:hypothetical protein
MASVPIFVSVPTKLNDNQQAIYGRIRAILRSARLSPWTVTGNVPPMKSPLAEITRLARRCAGGLILGFRQAEAERVVRWPGSRFEMKATTPTYSPSPWNQLEAGILYSLGVPMLIFAEEGVTGGIFDQGMGNFLIHEFSAGAFGETDADHMAILIREWGRHVISHHQGDGRDWRAQA